MKSFLILLLIVRCIRTDIVTLPDRKLVLNRHLFVWLSISQQTIEHVIQYQCLSNNRTLQISDKELRNIRSIALGREQNETQLYFVVTGVIDQNPYMSKVTVNCHDNEIIKQTVSFNETDYHTKNLVLKSNVDSRGKFAVISLFKTILFFDLINLSYWHKNITWPDLENFYAHEIEIITPFIYIIGQFQAPITEPGKLFYRAKLYVMEISCYINSTCEIDFLDSWISTGFVDDLLKPSISITTNRTIFVGVPQLNTVYVLFFNTTLQNVSSKTLNRPDYYRYHYGVEFVWLNQGKILVVVAVGKRRSSDDKLSILYFYDMLANNQITNDTTEFSQFSTGENDYPTEFGALNTRIVSSMSIYSTLYIYDNVDALIIIPPSLPGYYSTYYMSTKHIGPNTLSFTPNGVQCHPRTYKNDIGVWPCSICQPMKTNISLLDNQFNRNISITCPQCTNKAHCSLEAITEINWLNDTKQNGIYPESPDMDIFDDILLFHLFETNWNLKSPFFILLIVLFIVLVIIGVISLLKFSKRKYLIKFIRCFDLIGDGQLWFGGLISIAIIFIGIYALRFGFAYYNRYPSEAYVCDESNFCNENKFYNAKFQTSLQLIDVSLQQYKPIFKLLDSQEFYLNIELLNTLVHCGQINLLIANENSRIPFSCYTNDFILYLSAKLPFHNAHIELRVNSTEKIEAVRIGLHGFDEHITNNYLQKLNFSTVLNQTNRTLSSKPLLNLQLTKSINITESLTEDDNTTYSGLWLHTVDYDADRMFISSNSSSRTSTNLFIQLTNTPFFIRNKQEPIARKSEILFHTILFIGMCIDLVGMILLLLKLWFSPIAIYLLKRFANPKSFVGRLFKKKKNSSDILILKMQEDMKIMSQRIDALTNLIQQQYESNADASPLIMKERF